MCWMFAITVLPRCAKGACWWAKSTAAVWSHTPWVKSYSIPHCFHTAVHASRQKKQKTLSLSPVVSPPSFLSDLVLQVTLQPRHLYAVGRTISTTSCTQAYWEVVSFWLICIKILIQKKKKEEIWEKHKLHPLHDAGTNTMSCCAYSPSQLAEQTPQSHLWEQATLLRRGNNNEY